MGCEVTSCCLSSTLDNKKTDDAENKLVKDHLSSTNRKLGYLSKYKSNYYLAENENLLDRKYYHEYNIRDEYIKNLSDETKKCIAVTHLLGTIWYQFFNHKENKCQYIDYNDTESDDYFDILHHILVRGGCCRDVIWGKNFNDIDVMVNTRELNKLHSLHLRKFHSTKETQENSKCILWLVYARKFNHNKTSKEKKSDFDDDNMGTKIINSHYMLNAKFLLEILENDNRLKNKLSVGRMGSRVWNIRIIQKLIYNGYDINGVEFDFLDIKHGIIALQKEREQVAKIHDLHIQQSLPTSTTSLDDNYRETFSRQIYSKLKIFENMNNDYTAKPIDLPIYPLVFVTMSKWTDLTVNSMLIHFSDIITNKFNDKQIDYDWRGKVRNPSFEIDGITDCKEKRITTWGKNVNEIKHVIINQKPDNHIWRICKMWLKLNGEGYLENDLIRATMKMYPSWFSVKKLKEKDQYDDYSKDIANKFINQYAKKGKYDLRFECLELLQFNSICKDIMENMPKFKNYVNQTIDAINDNDTKTEIKTVMKEYGYKLTV